MSLRAADLNCLIGSFLLIGRPPVPEAAHTVSYPFTCLANVSLSPTTRLNTGSASVESASLQ